MTRYTFKDNPLTIDILNEAKTKALDFLEREFGHDRVFSTQQVEQFSKSLYKRIFKVLNATIFGNKLEPIPVIECVQNEIQAIVKRVNGVNYDPTLTYYAAYFPEFYANGTMKKQTIFLVTDNGLMTFMFVVSSICHELIHQYDFNYGDMKKIVLNHAYSQGIEHRTQAFAHFSILAKNQGINIMVSGKGIPFDILNKQMVQFTLNLQETEEYDDNWADYYKKRILTGDKKGIENMCIMPNGSIGIFIT